MAELLLRILPRKILRNLALVLHSHIARRKLLHRMQNHRRQVLAEAASRRESPEEELSPSAKAKIQFQLKALVQPRMV